ncbi:PAS domain-containing protein, partial [Campylobacter showae]
MQNSLQERQVSADAFLVSKTDTKGKITYCNIPFAQIVGAKGNELIGKPHN